MKKISIFAIAGFFIFIIGLFYTGCSNDNNPVTTGGGPTFIRANGTIQQIDRTNSTGTLIVVDQNGKPVAINSSNVTAYMSWPTRADSVAGTVTISSNTGSGKNVAAAVTMDYSGSMGTQQIQCMEQGVKTYINAMGTNDLTEIIKFDNQVIVAQTFTNDKNLLRSAVDSIYSLGGTTALYQSIYKGLQDVEPFSSNSYIKCVIAFTDGGENASSITRETMINQSLSTAIPVYSIFLYSDTSNTMAVDMRNIADTTGGFFFWAQPDSTCTSSLTGVYNTIKGQIAGSYTMNIVWPGANLPPTNTVVVVTIYVNYNGMKSSFSKSFIIL